MITLSMSGVVALQAFLYYRTYPNDHIGLKALVAFIWYVVRKCTFNGTSLTIPR
jgi:hypothetical protein